MTGMYGQRNAVLESQLRTYISTQLNNGYNIEMIKRALIGNGFDLSAVNAAAAEFSKTDINFNHRHEVKFSHGTILGIVFILMLGGGLFAFFNLDLFEPKDSLLDVSVDTNAYAYISGGNINYQIRIMNMGSDNRFDAIIKTVIIDDAGNIITRKEETIAVETTSSVNRNIQLPANVQSGKYYLKVIADYDGKQATSTSEFEVVKNVMNTGNTGTTTQNPAIDNPVNNPSAGNNLPSQGSGLDGVGIGSIGSPNSVGNNEFAQTLSEIRIESKNNPALASGECAALESLNQKDICYETIADSSGFTTYCAYIGDVVRRDNCYLAFVLKGNADVCDYIMDENSKTFCGQLKIIQLMDAYYAQNDTEKILELSKQLNPDIYTSSPPVIPQYAYTETATITIVDVIDESGVEIESEDTNNTNNSTQI